jgi:hypothetical protein
MNTDAEIMRREPSIKKCYQCDRATLWLAPDSRCRNCTRLTPEEVKGEEKCDV